MFDVMEITRHNDTVWNSYCGGCCCLSINWDREEVVVVSSVKVAADADGPRKLFSFHIFN